MNILLLSTKPRLNSGIEMLIRVKQLTVTQTVLKGHGKYARTISAGLMDPIQTCLNSTLPKLFSETMCTKTTCMRLSSHT